LGVGVAHQALGETQRLVHVAGRKMGLERVAAQLGIGRIGFEREGVVARSGLHVALGCGDAAGEIGAETRERRILRLRGGGQPRRD
jgi:hypothetical protein